MSSQNSVIVKTSINLMLFLRTGVRKRELGEQCTWRVKENWESNAHGE